jgi:hypothetical protein
MMKIAVRFAIYTLLAIIVSGCQAAPTAPTPWNWEHGFLVESVTRDESRTVVTFTYSTAAQECKKAVYKGTSELTSGPVPITTRGREQAVFRSSPGEHVLELKCLYHTDGKAGETNRVTFEVS